MDYILEEFIGKYIHPTAYKTQDEENIFHDPIIKGALFSNDLDFIESYLIRFSFLVNAQESFFHNNALFVACEYDLDDVVCLLLDYGAKISIKNMFGWGPYDIAYHHQSYNCKRLIKRKAVMLIEEAWINYKIKKEAIDDISYQMNYNLFI